jgi:hypothetical protein
VVKKHTLGISSLLKAIACHLHKPKKKKRKVWQAALQGNNRFIENLSKASHIYIQERQRTEIPLSKKTRGKIPTILKESPGEKKTMLQNKDHDEPLRPLFTLRSHPFAYFMSCIENAKSRLIANKAFLVLRMMLKMKRT